MSSCPGCALLKVEHPNASLGVDPAPSRPSRGLEVRQIRLAGVGRGRQQHCGCGATTPLGKACSLHPAVSSSAGPCTPSDDWEAHGAGGRLGGASSGRIAHDQGPYIFAEESLAKIFRTGRAAGNPHPGLPPLPEGASPLPSGLCHCLHSLARSPGTHPCPQSTLWDLAHCSWSGPRGNSQPGRRGSPRGGGLESQGLRDCNCCGPAQ